MPLSIEDKQKIMQDIANKRLPKDHHTIADFLTAAGDLAAIHDLPSHGNGYDLSDEAQALDAAQAIYQLNLARIEKAYHFPVSQHIQQGTLDEAEVFRLSMEYGAKGCVPKLKNILKPAPVATEMAPVADVALTTETDASAQGTQNNPTITPQTVQSIAPPLAAQLEEATPSDVKPALQINTLENASLHKLTLIPPIADQGTFPVAPQMSQQAQTPLQPNPAPPRPPHLGYTNFDLNNAFAADFTALPQHSGVNAHESPTSNIVMARSQINAQGKPQNPDIIGLYNIFGKNSHSQIQAKASALPAARIYHAQNVGSKSAPITTLGFDTGLQQTSKAPNQYQGYTSVVAHHHSAQLSYGVGTTYRYGSKESFGTPQLQARIDIGANTQSRTHRLRVVSDIGSQSTQTLGTICSNFSNNLGYQNTSYYLNTAKGSEPSHALYHYINLTPPQLNANMSAPRNHVTFSGAITRQGNTYSNFAEVGAHSVVGKKGSLALGGFVSTSQSGTRGTGGADPASPRIAPTQQTINATGLDVRLYDKTASKWSFEARLGLQNTIGSKQVQGYGNLALMHRL